MCFAYLGGSLLTAHANALFPLACPSSLLFAKLVYILERRAEIPLDSQDFKPGKELTARRVDIRQH